MRGYERTQLASICSAGEYRHISDEMMGGHHGAGQTSHRTSRTTLQRDLAMRHRDCSHGAAAIPCWG